MKTHSGDQSRGRTRHVENSRIKTEREIVDGEPVVRVKFGHWSPVCIFLMVWLTMWTFGCYMIVSELITKPFSLKLALFSIPFLAAEVGVATAILMMIFGRTVFTFRKDGGTKFSGIGRYGITKEFTFPVKGEICTDEVVHHGGKGGPRTYYRLVVKTQFDLDGPREIYSSSDPDVVYFLHQAALEVAGTIVPPAEKKSADEIAAEESEAERHDIALLADKPPKGLVVSRDFEGRVTIVLRRVRWLVALVLVLVMGGFATFFYFNISSVPMPAVVGFGFAMLFPFVQLLFVLFGKRTMWLDHGKGETFIGIGPIGMRRKFEYGGPFDVRLEESGMWVNNERMNELVIAKPGGAPRKICASWPNDVKPYLAALLRHPSSAPVSIGAEI